MLVKNTRLAIPPDDPFAPDKLDREESAQILTQLIEHTDESFVLALDSAWGTGKSTFVEMWKALLETEKFGYRTLYFNAWENDFAADPLLALLAEFEQIPKPHDGSEKLFEDTKRLASDVVRYGVPALVKIASNAVGVPDGLADTLLAVVKGGEKDALAAFKDTRKSLDGFREALGKYMHKLKELGHDKPVIFFVDELDRCRPTYAIELLERIKHLFSVDGIVFVLALDREQLSHSIKTVYGNNMDAQGYLARFFDLEYQLPDPPWKKVVNHLLEFYGVKDIVGQRNANRSDEYEQIEATLVGLAPRFSLSVRDAEKCISRLNIVLRSTELHKPVFPLLLSALLLMRIKDHETYRKFVTQNPEKGFEFLTYLHSKSEAQEVFNRRFEGQLEFLVKWGFMSQSELVEEINSGAYDRRGVDNAILQEVFTSERAPIIPYLARLLDIGFRFNG